MHRSQTEEKMVGGSVKAEQAACCLRRHMELMVMMMFV